MKNINKVSVENRKAHFNYEFLENYEAGISLQGCEIKSIRNGGVNMSDAFCIFEGNELFVRNMHISPYENAGFAYKDYDPKRDRKLLLTKRELRKMHQEVKTKGITIVPVRMYSNDKGLVKVSIALAKGKHEYDKSQTIKERDLDREMNQYK